MMATRQTRLSREELEARVRRELPDLGEAETADLARIVDTLVATFAPERIYVYGSRARGATGEHSDVDLLVVVPDAGEFPHHLDQAAYRAVGPHLLPLDLLFMSQEEFDWRAEVVTSLPATVLREGRTLYAAAE